MQTSCAVSRMFPEGSLAAYKMCCLVPLWRNRAERKWDPFRQERVAPMIKCSVKPYGPGPNSLPTRLRRNGLQPKKTAGNTWQYFVTEYKPKKSVFTHRSNFHNTFLYIFVDILWICRFSPIYQYSVKLGILCNIAMQ